MVTKDVFSTCGEPCWHIGGGCHSQNPMAGQLRLQRELRTRRVDAGLHGKKPGSSGTPAQSEIEGYASGLKKASFPGRRTKARESPSAPACSGLLSLKPAKGAGGTLPKQAKVRRYLNGLHGCANGHLLNWICRFCRIRR